MLIWCMVLHFIADFLLQSREMGQKKSSELSWLLKHLAIQTGIIFIGLAPFVGLIIALKFALLNSVVHGVIDWNVWKFYKLSAHKRIIKEIRAEYLKKFGEPTWLDDQSIIEVGAPEMYKEKVTNWKYWEDHWFYTTIGFDQLLHTATLIILAGAFL